MRLDTMAAWYSVTAQDDDEVGGAQLSGTYVQSFNAHFQEDAVDSSFYQQGLEVDRIFSCWTLPIRLGIKARDEVEITSPTSHPYFGRRFKVLSDLPAPLHIARGQGFLELKLRLRDYSR